VRYLSTLLLATSLTTAVAQPSHQDLLYSADITTGESRLFGGMTLEGKFPVIDTKPSDFGPVWKVEAGKLMILRFSLPVAIENCQLKVRELGLPRSEAHYPISLLLMNENRIHRLQVADQNDPQTRFYNLAQNLHAGENVLKIGGLDHDLGIQSVVIHCTAPLPVAFARTARITLLAPVAGQNIPADKPLDIVWTTANLPEYARFDLDYLDKNGDWQTLDKGIPYNYPTHAGNRGFYRWYQTRVCVECFWMGKTEVTNVQYQYKQSHDSGYDRHPDRNFNGENQPVVKVSQSQAHAYSQWHTPQTGENFRLPTEAEWEYAARAGQTTAYFWGNNPNEACHYANIADRKLAQTQDIKDVQNFNPMALDYMICSVMDY